ncbi:MAG: hypothetical protein HW387_1363 [Parachlamydiales bacterium]|nr:hypothetical protein [Parachlamydiales bacterium]
MLKLNQPQSWLCSVSVFLKCPLFGNQKLLIVNNSLDVPTDRRFL